MGLLRPSSAHRRAKVDAIQPDRAQGTCHKHLFLLNIILSHRGTSQKSPSEPAKTAKTSAWPKQCRIDPADCFLRDSETLAAGSL
jgi:hypothetical protein